MEYMTIQKNITSSPRKLRLVADMVRKMNPYSAIDVLLFTKNAAARPLAQAIKTVIANSGSKEVIAFKSIEINEGLKMKRYRVGTAGRGRGRPYKKRTSHIKIILTDEIKVKPAKLTKKSKVVVAPIAEDKQSLRSDDLKQSLRSDDLKQSLTAGADKIAEIVDRKEQTS